MKSSKGVTRIQRFSSPLLVKDFDNSWRQIGYESRSKAAHDAFRNFISEYKWTRKEAEVVGTIAMFYYLDKPRLLNQIVAVQHKFEHVVTCGMHFHLTKDKCLEIIVVKGKASEIRNLSQELVTNKGVKELQFSVIAL